MKQILNWTAGGFFRTLGRILVYVVLGFIISLFVANSGIKLPSWLIMKVDAATTITPSSYKHSLVYDIYTGDNITDHVGTSWFTGDMTNFCPSGKICALTTDNVTFTFSTSLDSGKTYTINFNTWVTTRPDQDELNSVEYWFTASNTGQYDGSSPNKISAFSCRAGIEQGTTTKISWSCSFTPSTAINYIYIRMIPYEGWLPFTSYGSSNGSLVYDNSQTDAINQQTNIIQNQTDIINNNITDSTNQIINGLDGINEANQICQFIDKSSVVQSSYNLNSNGDSVFSSSSYGVTDYYKISSSDSLSIKTLATTYSCFYDTNKTKISCIYTTSDFPLGNITIPSNASYFRATIRVSNNAPTFNLCRNGNQALNDTLIDDNTTDSSNKASEFLWAFDLPEHNNLVTIATLPLQLVQSLVNDDYTDLCFTLSGQQACIPSGRIIWNRTECSPNAPFGCGSINALKTFFNLVVGGFLSWKLLKSIFIEIHTALDPTADAVSWGVKKL